MLVEIIEGDYHEFHKTSDIVIKKIMNMGFIWKKAECWSVTMGK